MAVAGGALFEFTPFVGARAGASITLANLGNEEGLLGAKDTLLKRDHNVYRDVTATLCPLATAENVAKNVAKIELRSALPGKIGEVPITKITAPAKGGSASGGNYARKLFFAYIPTDSKLKRKLKLSLYGDAASITIDSHTALLPRGEIKNLPPLYFTIDHVL